jgi:hypothetical protein
VRVVGPVFNVQQFKHSPAWNRWVSVVSYRFFPEVGDAETQRAIDASVAAMHARMRMKDTHASSEWSMQNQFKNFCIYPPDNNLSREQDQKRVKVSHCRMKFLLVFMCCTGLAFWFLCILGLFVHNPVLRYAKEFSVKKFKTKQIAVINEEKVLCGPGFFGFNPMRTTQGAERPRELELAPAANAFSSATPAVV